MLWASGKYNCVLSGCVEFGDSVAVPNHPYHRKMMDMAKFLETTAWIYNRAYTRSLIAGPALIFDDAAEEGKNETMDRKSLEKKIIEFSISYHKDVSELSVDTRKKDLDGASILMVGLVSLIENELDVLVQLPDAAAAKTIGEIVDKVEALM
jgi:acyl carrier protein